MFSITKKHLSYLIPILILLIALFTIYYILLGKNPERELQSTNTEQTQEDTTTDQNEDQLNGTDQQLEIKAFFAPQAITDACTTATFTFKVTNLSQEDFTYERITDKLYAIELVWLDEDNEANVLGSSSNLSRVAEFQPITAGQSGSVTFTLISTTNCNPSDSNRCNGFELFYPNGAVDLYARIVGANESELARSGKITIDSQVWSDLDSGQAFICGDTWVYPEEDE